MKCNVIILNWNGAEMLRTYLPSVVKSLVESRDVELIVADNGSTDESLAVLSKEFPSVKTIVLDQNYGFAEGYNRAIEQVDSEYVVLLNSDVEMAYSPTRLYGCAPGGGSRAAEDPQLARQSVF